MCAHSVGDAGPPGPYGERRDEGRDRERERAYAGVPRQEKAERERERERESARREKKGEGGRADDSQQPAVPSAADRFIEWHVPIRSNVVLYFSALD